MKEIRQFRSDSGQWIIDLAGRDSSAIVDGKTGDIHLNEGTGDDRFDNAIISRSAFARFSLNAVSNIQWELTVGFGLIGEHVLGTTSDKSAAEEWMRSATFAVESPVDLQHLPSRLPPFTVPPDLNAGTPIRLQNDGVRTVKLILQPWNERYVMEPNAAVDVLFYGLDGSQPSIAWSDASVTLSTGSVSFVKLFVVRLGSDAELTPWEIIQSEVRRARSISSFAFSNQNALTNAVAVEGTGLDTMLASEPVWAQKYARSLASRMSRLLAASVQTDERLKWEVIWRVTARILGLVELRFALFHRSAEYYFERLQKMGLEDDDTTWMDELIWNSGQPAQENSEQQGRTPTHPDHQRGE